MIYSRFSSLCSASSSSSSSSSCSFLPGSSWLRFTSLKIILHEQVYVFSEAWVRLQLFFFWRSFLSSCGMSFSAGPPATCFSSAPRCNTTSDGRRARRLGPVLLWFLSRLCCQVSRLFLDSTVEFPTWRSSFWSGQGCSRSCPFKNGNFERHLESWTWNRLVVFLGG